MHYRLPRGLALRNPSQEPFCGIIGNSVRQVNRAAVATEIPGDKNPMKLPGRWLLLRFHTAQNSVSSGLNPIIVLILG
jgi:hypothetical protein